MKTGTPVDASTASTRRKLGLFFIVASPVAVATTRADLERRALGAALETFAV